MFLYQPSTVSQTVEVMRGRETNSFIQSGSSYLFLQFLFHPAIFVKTSMGVILRSRFFTPVITVLVLLKEDEQQLAKTISFRVACKRYFLGLSFELVKIASARLSNSSGKPDLSHVNPIGLIQGCGSIQQEGT